MIRILYFICIIFVKNIIMYWLILTVNHQGSYFPFFFFFFFCLHPVGQTFLHPSKFCNYLKHSAKNRKNYLYTTYVLVCQNCTLIFSRTRKHMSMLFAYMAGREGVGARVFENVLSEGSQNFSTSFVCMGGGGGCRVQYLSFREKKTPTPPINK